MKYIINNTGIVLFHNGAPIKIEKDSAAYRKILLVFDLPVQEQEEKIEAILQEASGYLSKDGFEISPEVVTYQGEELPSSLAEKVRSLAHEGLPLSLFSKFWENIQLNPSASSVRELYDFLSYKELPITEDGCFIAYKGVDSGYWSISGNNKTKVLQGKKNCGGKIYNGIGERIEVRRWDVDDNRDHHCSFGLHVGSLKYAEEFAPAGGNILIVKVNPKDVVSVPTDFNCQKCRVAAYEVVSLLSTKQDSCGHLYEDYDDPVAVYEDGEEIVSEEEQEYSAFETRILKYLLKKAFQGNREVSVQAIQNSFSPEYPSRVRVLDAVSELGYVWYAVDGIEYIQL